MSNWRLPMLLPALLLLTACSTGSTPEAPTDRGYQDIVDAIDRAAAR